MLDSAVKKKKHLTHFVEVENVATWHHRHHIHFRLKSAVTYRPPSVDLFQKIDFADL